MSRHRRERVPRHRAQRLAGQPARRAQVTPAVPAPRTGLDDVGLDDVGLDRAALLGSGLAGAGLPETGLAGAEPAGDRLAGTTPDDTETAPPAGLTWTLPRGFESEIARLASLVVTDDGALYDRASGTSASDNSASDTSASDNSASDNSASDNGDSDNGDSDNRAADNGTRDRVASALRPPDYRPPSHSRRRTRQAARAAARQPARNQPGVARGLLVTPWFAAATGFVIAVSMWIYAPHPKLSLGDPAIGMTQCKLDGCAQPPQKQGGSLYGNSKRLHRPHKTTKPPRTGARNPTRTATSGLTFSYYVARPAADGSFKLLISVTGKLPVKDWHLVFVLRGDHIQYVSGAQWQVAGGDRVSARPFTGDPGQQHGWPGDGGGQSYSGYDSAHYQPGVLLTVYASGPSAVPTHCSFDGARCKFSEVSGDNQGWPGNSAATKASQRGR